MPLYCGQQFSHNAPKPQPHIATTGKPFLSAVNSHYRCHDIDTLESDLVLGTIPGADTVFAAVKEGTPRHELYTLFSSFIPEHVMLEAAHMFDLPEE